MGFCTPCPARHSLRREGHRWAARTVCGRVRHPPRPVWLASASWTRRELLQRAVALSAAAALAGWRAPVAVQATAPNQRKAMPGYELSGEYLSDAQRVMDSMRVASEMQRGTPDMKEKVDAVRKQMNDFVAMYRRNPKVATYSSFLTLYTAINTLAGHYASYGSTYPVPEKRRKRLEQQFKDVDRLLKRGR
ncbi:hypothetical protein CDCA_CDCA04G1280 [Cyanidium caldarium]|uniref:Photosystem II 11 kDa protein n=1 Tax=Cyanidium caldarium TaxID=2771 RepID=A0AAV9IT29_CYACA|nr:hypothetical protein CDCA_CDCA04G1280 [Cyanidium caldarium]